MKNISILSLLSLLFLFGFNSQKAKNQSPNIVLIFMDDLGYGDLGVTGALQYETPNINRLAAEGMRFTNFLTAQAVCSASRAALMTGCYPNRIGFSGALMPTAKVGINSSETTLAELLKQKGYATAIAGKWHLGHLKQFLPLQHGFDEYLGLPYSNDMWPVGFDGVPAKPGELKSQYPPLPLIKNNETSEIVKNLDDQSKLTQRYTEFAVNFIKKNQKKPFFLYLPHSMPHVPIAASEKFKGKSKQGLYGDMMMEVDWSVGQIMAALKTNGLDQNTLVIFTSDNGPWLNFGNHAGSSGGFREGKGTIFEGGHRVPCIFRWKGIVQQGVTSNQLTSTIDIFPTIASIINAKLPDVQIDGVNILPVLQNKNEASLRKYFYYYYNQNSLKAVRRDDWKLLLPHPSRSYEKYLPANDGFPGKTDENNPMPKALFDLRRDPGERYDVQSIYPEIVTELEKIAELAREDLGDDLTNRQGKNRRQIGK
ncbi:MAG: sulfatase [Bacteroidota bacterium]